MSKIITGLPAITSVQTDDVLPIVDVHDTTQASTGTTKKAAVSALPFDAAGAAAAAQTAAEAYSSPTTTLGDTIYGGASGVPARLAGNATITRKFLRQAGTGTASAAPAWDTLQSGDIPTGLYAPAVYKMPAPSGGDDTAAFQAALAALPTTTIYANNVNNSGASVTVHYGTIFLGSGTYKLGASGDIGNIGPMVNIVGPGRNACTLAYYGAGDCLRAYNPVFPLGWDAMGAWYGTISGFTIDGTSAQAGASGLHYGDIEGGVLGPDLMIKNFSQGTLSGAPALSLGSSGSGGTFGAGTYFWQVTAITRTGETAASNEVSAAVAANGTQVLNWAAVSGATGYRIYRGTYSGGESVQVTQTGAVTTYTDTGTPGQTNCPPGVNFSGNTGLWLDNTVSWTENTWGRVLIRNCANAVVFDATAGPSFEYNDLTFKIYAFPAQNGIVLCNGAAYNNGSLKARGNFGDSSSPMSTAFLALVGAYSGGFSYIGASHLELQGEVNTLTSSGGGGSYTPMTISFSDPVHNLIYGCEGVLSFYNVGNAWTPSNWGGASSTVRTNFRFFGIVQGDTGLAPGNAASTNPVGIGAQELAQGYTQTSGWMPVASGDVFSLTLTQSISVALASTGSSAAIGGPQRKTILITQAASGGPYTVTWPQPGSPSLTSPAVYWPGGVAPVMSTTAGATDRYILETADGIHWYGAAFQARPALITVSGGGTGQATDPMPSWMASDSGWLEQNFDPMLMGTTLAGGFGTVYAVRVNVRAAITVTSVILFLGSNGTSLTSGQNLAGLYTSAGTQVGITADQTANWGSGAAKFIQAPLAGGPYSISPGYCWVVFVANGTGTVPGFGRANSYTTPSANPGLTASAYRWAVGAASQTALPASFTPSTYFTSAAQGQWWAGLS